MTFGSVRAMRSVTGLALVIAGTAAAGCGSSNKPACGVLANGQRLCGADLKAYCQKFEHGSLDADTILACEQAGVRVSPASTGPVSSYASLLATCRAQATRSGCAAAARYLDDQGIAHLSADQARCIGQGGRPLVCVRDEP